MLIVLQKIVLDKFVSDRLDDQAVCQLELSNIITRLGKQDKGQSLVKDIKANH